MRDKTNVNMPAFPQQSGKPSSPSCQRLKFAFVFSSFVLDCDSAALEWNMLLCKCVSKKMRLSAYKIYKKENSKNKHLVHVHSSTLLLKNKYANIKLA